MVLVFFFLPVDFWEEVSLQNHAHSYGVARPAAMEMDFEGARWVGLWLLLRWLGFTPGPRLASLAFQARAVSRSGPRL